MRHISRTYVETEDLGRRLCRGGKSGVGRRRAHIGAAHCAERAGGDAGQAPAHRLASMAGKSPRSNWTSAWGLQAVRAWHVVHVWQTCRSIRKMGRIVPRWCSILSYRHRARNLRLLLGCGSMFCTLSLNRFYLRKSASSAVQTCAPIRLTADNADVKSAYQRKLR